MDAYSPVDVDRACNCRISSARNKNFNRSRSAVGEIGRSLEWPAFELQVSRIPIRTRRCFDRVLRRARLRELANWGAVSCDSNPDWLLADLRRRALFIGRRLRGRSWNSVRAPRLAIRVPESRQTGSGFGVEAAVPAANPKSRARHGRHYTLFSYLA